MGKEISTTAKLYYNSGNNAADRGNYEEAIKNYSEAIRLAPNYTNAYFNRGDAYDETGEYDKAIADYSEVIRIDQSADAYLNRGVVFYKKGEDDRAIADLTERIRIDPNCASAYKLRGEIYNNKGEMERAIADAEMALKINNPGAYNHLQNTKKEVEEKNNKMESVEDIQTTPEPIQLVYVLKSSRQVNKAENLLREISKKHIVSWKSSYSTYFDFDTLHVFFFTNAAESEIESKIRATGAKFVGRFNENATPYEIVEKLKKFKAKQSLARKIGAWVGAGLAVITSFNSCSRGEINGGMALLILGTPLFALGGWISGLIIGWIIRKTMQ